MGQRVVLKAGTRRILVAGYVLVLDLDVSYMDMFTS